ncbi:cell division control protein 6 homolog [Mya arenaria]|uniref:cell division control protein 6 homolog n=1 Tax=Mya arenaria TaxID=6604 RepID=UPI0022E7D136|nr:cell division control protein 6 homolog [Mya arenaria]
MSTAVQRKLEFPVRKSSRLQKIVPQTQDESVPKTRSTRKSARKTRKDENTPVQQSEMSPRKRHSDDENQPVFNTPSPSKKIKNQDENLSPQRRDETPVRGSLAAKLAAAKLSDEAIKKELSSPKKEQIRTPLSPIKSQMTNYPETRSPLKTLLQGRPLLSSPCKSPRKLLISSPAKSPRKLLFEPNSPHMSPRKSLCQTSSPHKSPRKSLCQPSSPLKSPSMKLGKPDCTAYHKAKQMFHTAKPERLIGRDKETEEVRLFLKGHMSKKTGGSLYISGAPGTGKTAVLTHIIDELKSVHSCKTVYLNCMTLDNSSTVYGKLYTDITGKNAPTAKERLRAVERVLTTDGPSIVMVLDEIDQLDSKNQEILYTIFEWPSLKKSRLILVGIANALDLTDRVLPRLQARPSCRPRLLNFAPYTKDQISAILKDRIKDLESDLVDVVAIQFCARKISAVAGDMRKALDVCRRAVEMVETDVRSQKVLQPTASGLASPSKQSPRKKVPKKISVAHINNVLSDVYGSGAAAKPQETIPLQQQLAVCSLLLLLKQGKMKEVPAGKLHETYSKVCKGRQMAAVDQSEFQSILTLMESRGIIGMKKAKETRLNKVTLKLDEKELEHTMQDKLLVSSILQEGIPK